MLPIVNILVQTSYSLILTRCVVDLIHAPLVILFVPGISYLRKLVAVLILREECRMLVPLRFGSSRPI